MLRQFLALVASCRWPAMIEEDPDEEAYYELGRGSNPVPVSQQNYYCVSMSMYLTVLCR